MTKQQEYASIINEAYHVSKDYICTTESLRRIETAKNALLEDIERDAFMKVPFVGDFDAGKSSLLNALMGIDLLPTDIVPTTAVSYELYYSNKEQLKVYHKGELKETKPISQIRSLDVVPGDVVYVYIDNDFVKKMNERGIVVVDMPGIDSGIEAHNNAILNYIREGSFFFLVTDAEQGTLRRSAIRFVDELKKYNLKCDVLISKIDKKSDEAMVSVKAEIESQAKKAIRSDIEVGVSSAATKNFDDVIRMLDKLDAEEFFTEKYSKEVSNFVSDIINELQLQIRLTLSDKKDFSAKIESLKTERAKAIVNIRSKDSAAQPLSNSTEDILNDVREALIAKSDYLAALLYNSSNNKDAFSNEVLSIIRPILVNSFKREISEYQNVIGDSVKEFALNVDEILQDKDNDVLNKAKDMLGDVLGKGMLEEVLRKGLDKLMLRLASYKGLSTLLSTIGKFLGPLTTILIHTLPDLLNLIFGKSKEQKIDAIRQKIASEVVGKITDALRTPIEKMLEEQRSSVMQNMETLIDEEALKYDSNIQTMLQEQQASEAEITAKVKKLEDGIGKLSNVLQSI